MVARRHPELPSSGSRISQAFHIGTPKWTLRDAESTTRRRPLRVEVGRSRHVAGPGSALCRICAFCTAANGAGGQHPRPSCRADGSIGAGRCRCGPGQHGFSGYTTRYEQSWRAAGGRSSTKARPGMPGSRPRSAWPPQGTGAPSPTRPANGSSLTVGDGDAVPYRSPRPAGRRPVTVPRQPAGRGDDGPRPPAPPPARRPRGAGAAARARSSTPGSPPRR